MGCSMKEHTQIRLLIELAEATHPNAGAIFSHSSVSGGRHSCRRAWKPETFDPHRGGGITVVGGVVVGGVVAGGVVVGGAVTGGRVVGGTVGGVGGT